MTKDVRPRWPRRSPVAAFAGLVLGLCATMLFVAVRVRFANDAQRFYAKQYMTPLGPSWVAHKPRAVDVLLCGQAHATDDCPAVSQTVISQAIPPAAIDQWLRTNVYEGHTLWQWLAVPLWLGGLAAIGFMVLGGIADRKHNREARNGRRLRGPELVEPRAFNRKVNGDGFRIFLEKNRNLVDKATRRTRRTSIRIKRRHENNNICAMADPGGGKALDVNTPVLTPTGYRPIGEIKVGDLVIGKSGRPTEVKGVYPQGTKPAFRVGFDDGSDTVCCDEHLWEVRNLNHRKRGQKSVMTLAKIRTSMETQSVSKYAIPICDPVQFSKKTLPLDPYLLGALIGDGHLKARTPIISTADSQMLEILAKVVSAMGIVLFKAGGNKYDYRLKLSWDGERLQRRQLGATMHRPANPITVVLAALGLKCASALKFIPDAYLHSSVADRVALLQGLLDTDGSGKKNGLVEFTSASRRLADDVVWLARSLGCVCSMRVRRTKYTHLGEQREGAESYRVWIRVPTWMTPFRLERKMDMFRHRTKFGLLRHIKTIEPAGDRDMVCIRVAAEDGLFVINDFIVTHNTLLCFQILDQVQERGEAAFIYDPHMQFTPRYYDEDRGDRIINPLDDRCPSWSPSDEIDTRDRAMAEANALAQAASLFPGKPADRNWFFTYCCRLIWAYLIVEHQPDAHEMAHLLQHADPLIDIIVQETELKTMMAENAANQRAGVLGHLTQIAYSLRQIPNRSEGRPHLILRDWARTRQGWLFFTNTQDTRDGLRPIQSLMLDWLIMCILSEGERKDLPSTMAMFDELQTLQRLEQLVALLTEGRKSLRVMYCIQGRSQIKDLYGELSEVLLSAPYSKFFMRTTEPEASKWLSETVGEVEIERIHESRPVNAVGTGTTRTYTSERRIERLLLPSEFSGLDDLHGYLKYGNLICRLKMPIMPKIQKEPAFVPRAGERVIQKPLPTMEMIKRLQAEKNAEKAKKAIEAAAEKEEDRKAEQEKMMAVIKSLVEATVALNTKPAKAQRKKPADDTTGDLYAQEVGMTE